MGMGLMQNQLVNPLAAPPSKALAALTPKEGGTSPLPPAAMPNKMASTAMTPQVNPYAAAMAPKPKQNGLLEAGINGFMRGFRPEQWQADQQQQKMDGAERAKQTLALMQQQRQIPAEQRAQWWQQNADQIGQIVGADVKSLPMDPNSFTDQALDGQIAMMSAKLGIAPATPEPMTAYEAAQIKQKEAEAARLAGAPIKMGEDTLLDPNTYQPLYQAAPKPEKPPSWQTQTIGNRVIAYNPQDPKQTMDMGPAPVTGAGARGGLTDYQAVQTQMKLDDLDRELTAGDEKARNSLATLDSSIALLDKFTGDTDKFNATYGNMMNPTGKKDDMFNWSIAMDDNRKDGMAMLNQLGGQAFIDSIREMKSAGGAGSLSDAEGTKLAVAATRLMEVNQTDAAAKEAADEFRLRLTTFRNALEKDMAAKRQAEVGRRQQMQAMMGAGGQRAPTAADASDDDILSALGLK